MCASACVCVCVCVCVSVCAVRFRATWTRPVCDYIFRPPLGAFTIVLDPTGQSTYIGMLTPYAHHSHIAIYAYTIVLDPTGTSTYIGMSAHDIHTHMQSCGCTPIAQLAHKYHSVCISALLRHCNLLYKSWHDICTHSLNETCCLCISTCSCACVAKTFALIA